ncbi:MAG: c-type cytochrome [Betaproteobacteria bacterium]
MSSSRRSGPAARAVRPVGLAVLGVLALAGAAHAAPIYGFGKPATAAEIAGWDIDVRPDGRGLPAGRGSVEQGQAIYDEKCASCHGTFGESNSYMQIAGGVGSLASDQPLRTTGSKLNYATTLWDYIRRSMPFTAPQTLSADEVYALTAYVLNLNDVVAPGTELDQYTLPRVRMPNRDGLTTAHGLMRADGKPDTANTACMRDCIATVRAGSEIPGYARGSHGDLAQQRREMGAIAGVPMSVPSIGTANAAGAAVPNTGSATTVAGPALARRLGCTTCHSVDSTLVGPSFRAVAARYNAPPPQGRPDAQSHLVAKVRIGGAGAWGAIPMPAQAQVSESDTRKVVEWILGGAQ